MNEETKEIVRELAQNIYDMTLSYTLAATPELKKKHLEAIEIKTIELKAFIRAAINNDAV